MRTRKQAYRQRRAIRKMARMQRRASKGAVFPADHPAAFASNIQLVQS